MSSTLISGVTIAATGTGIYNFNLRQEMRRNMMIIILSDKALSATLIDGIGGDDPSQIEPSPQPYIIGAATGVTYDGIGSSYTVTANVNKEIRIDRTVIGDWLEVKLINTEVTAATISILGTFI